MRRTLLSVGVAMFLLAFGASSASAGHLVFESKVQGNVAGQVIADQVGSGLDWAIRSGKARIFRIKGDKFVLTLSARGLVIPGPPFFGTSPSPDFLARVVCHDGAGETSIAAITRAAPLSPSGNGFLIDKIELPEICYAPIILIGGSGNPGFFALSGF